MKARFLRVVRWLLRPDSAWHLVVAMLCVLVGLFFDAVAFFLLNLVVGYYGTWLDLYMFLEPGFWAVRVGMGLYAVFCAVRFGVLFRQGRRVRCGVLVGILVAASALGVFVASRYGSIATRVADEMGLYLHIRRHIDVVEIERRIRTDPQALRDEIAATRVGEDYCPPLRLDCLRFWRCRVKSGDGYVRIWYSHSFDLSSHGILIVTGQTEISDMYRRGTGGLFALSPNVYYWISLPEPDYTMEMARILRRLGLFADVAK